MNWLDEYMELIRAAYGWDSGPLMPEPVPNTFLSNPVPREGYIDARRSDGCVPVITNL